MKYKLQWFDDVYCVWHTFFSYNSLEEAMSHCPGLAASKVAKVRIVIEVEVVVYKYNQEA